MGLNKEEKNKLGHRRREDLRAAGHQVIPVFMSIAQMCTFPVGISSYVFKLGPGAALSKSKQKNSTVGLTCHCLINVEWMSLAWSCFDTAGI